MDMGCLRDLRNQKPCCAGKRLVEKRVSVKAVCHFVQMRVDRSYAVE